jgi:hypothetical protein
MKRKHFFIFVFLFVILGLSIAEKTISAKNNSEQSLLTPADINVIAYGWGTNEKTALKNAFQNAIQQSLGVYVDSEFLLQNEKMIEDRINTASNGFIDKYDQINVRKTNGGLEVQIRAVIKKNKILHEIKTIKSTTALLEDAKSLQTRIETRTSSKNDSETILRKSFGDFLDNSSLKDLIKINILDVEFLEASAKKSLVPVKIEYSISLDKKIYLKKVQVLERILKSIGAKLEEQVDLPLFKFNHLFGQSFNRLNKLKPFQFFIIKEAENFYKTDVWTFPYSFEGIFPFETNPEPYKISLPLRFVLNIEIVDKEGNALFADLIKLGDSRYINESICCLFSSLDFDVQKVYYRATRGGKIRGLFPFITKDRKIFSEMIQEFTANMPLTEIRKIHSVIIELMEI